MVYVGGLDQAVSEEMLHCKLTTRIFDFAIQQVLYYQTICMWCVSFIPCRSSVLLIFNLNITHIVIYFLQLPLFRSEIFVKLVFLRISQKVCFTSQHFYLNKKVISLKST